MTRTTNQQKEQFWKAHLTQAKHFNGNISRYCQSQGLNVHTFKYWKRQLANRLTEPRSLVPSSFVPVKVSTPELQVSRRSLPDPKWLGEFAAALIGGLR
jgi:transposase-like protein